MFVHTVIMVIEPHMKQGRQHKLISTIFLATSVTKKLDHNSSYAKPSVEQLRDAMESVPTPVSDEAPMWEGNEDEMARLCGLR